MTDSLINRISVAVKDMIQANDQASRRAMAVEPIESIRFLAGRQAALLDVQDRIATIARDADLEDHL